MNDGPLTLESQPEPRPVATVERFALDPSSKDCNGHGTRLPVFGGNDSQLAFVSTIGALLQDLGVLMNSTGAARSAHPQPCVIILLVEDAPADIILIKEALETCPVPVALTLAEDGEKALSLLMEGEIKPDLVILDLNIPKVSGHSVLEQYHPTEKPPVVVFSSTWSQTDIQRAIALGAREVVHKPMDVQAFMDAVRGIVRRWGIEGHLAP
jgi:CheY-like chemotaxis protein